MVVLMVWSLAILAAVRKEQHWVDSMEIEWVEMLADQLVLWLDVETVDWTAVL
jgi:hypothetical protein